MDHHALQTPRNDSARQGSANRLRIILLLVLLTFGLLACDNQRTQVDMTQTADKLPTAPKSDSRPELRIAVSAMISPETTRDYYEKLLRLIADHMGRKAVFMQRRSYAEVNELVKKREVDFAFVCSGPYTQGHAEFGMELLAVPVVHGEKVYHSYIIAHRDSDLRTFDELKGHKFAFTDPRSNTGCMVPTYMLARRGTTPKEFFKESFFSNSHDNSIKAVADGLSDGAAVDSLIWEFMQTIDPALTSQTRIIEKSPAYGIPPIVVHPELDPAIKRQLRDIFLTLDQDPQAREILAKLQIERFATGDDAMYDTVREMSRWLEKQPVK